MPRQDHHNRAEFRAADTGVGDRFGLMAADFGTWVFAPHAHDELVLVVTEAGVGRFTSRGVADYGVPRTALVFNPGQAHAGGVVDDTGWRYRALYIGGAALDGLTAGRFARPSTRPSFDSTVLDDPQVAQAIARTHAAYWSDAPRLAREQALLSALDLLIGRHGRPAPRPPSAGREPDAIRRAQDLMRSRLAEDLGIAELAAAVDLAPEHFRRVFRRVTGLPPYAFLLQCRVEAARLRLVAGDPPADAAIAAGFCDQSHLTRHFKRVWGVTPAHYAAAMM